MLKTPEAGPINILQLKFYAMLFFKHFDWSKNLGRAKIQKCLEVRSNDPTMTLNAMMYNCNQKPEKTHLLLKGNYHLATALCLTFLAY